MIGITKYLYIHILTIFLFIVCFLTGQLEQILIAYAIMLVHEMSHLAAAVCIGLRPEKLVIYPFGVNLKLKNKMVYSLADEIILYAAGPLSNIAMALAAVCFFSDIPYSYDFYVQNMALFFVNLLPVVPLDGGIIVKKILSYYIGSKKAEKRMRIISVFLIAAIAGTGAYFSAAGTFNYSLCFLCIFLVLNIVTSGEKYNIDFLRELLYYKENKNLNKPVKIVAFGEGGDLAKIVSDFTGRYYYVVFFVNSNGKVTQMLTETEIIEKICKK